jgi:hypothetical protein
MKIKISEETKKYWRNILPIDYRVGLNSNLIKTQDLSRVDVGIIFGLHGQKLALFDEARNMLHQFAEKGVITKKDRIEIERINNILEALEFNAQKAWGFEENEDYHNWWMDLPGCVCPQMDNRERQGIPGYIHTADCPWHGLFDKKLKEI